MPQPSVIVETDARGVATVTLDRPDVHNAFDDALIGALDDAFTRLDADPGVRVVVLAAKGKSFSAGADLNWMQRTAGFSHEENLADARRLAAMMRSLHRLGRPTIARVQGAAIGGGVGLVACCDIAVASERARFALSEVRLGLIPAVISPYVVRAMGERRARRYMLSAERFGAVEALQAGLVHEVVGEDALDDRIESLVGQLLENGPQAMAAAKSLLDRVAAGSPNDEVIEETARRIADVRVTGEGREGVAAFLDKRKPRWPGPGR